MNMTTMSIKNYSLLITGILLSFILFCATSCKEKKDNQFQLQTFETKGGWGYNILQNDKVIISQPIIPTIDKKTPFPSEKSAKAIGQIVLQRIQNKEDFSVSKQEVEYSLSY